MTDWETKDSGKRVDYASGMRRDTQEGKVRFDLLFVDGMPHDDQFIGRMAGLLTRGAEKYGERNWQLANSEEELTRFKASAARHFAQWLAGERDEDHAAAVAVNLLFFAYVEWKLDNAKAPASAPPDADDSERFGEGAAQDGSRRCDRCGGVGDRAYPVHSQLFDRRIRLRHNPLCPPL